MNQSISLSWSPLETPVAPARVQLDKVQLDKLSNYDLILRAQAGAQPDRAAFTELMQRYRSHVDRLLYHLAPDWQDRTDLSQEVWIRVFRNLKNLNEPEKFRGWLSRITTNLFYDELRKRKRNAHPLSLDAPIVLDGSEIDWEIAADAPSPEDNLSTTEFYEQLRRAIYELPEAFRQTIILREIDGRSYEEIAEVTQVSIGTVKSRIARARLRLQEQLSGYLGT
jgi:RNA polymerase sigma factor (sigma-70 family)